MYKINKLQHGKHFVRDFSHSLVLYQKSHSFAAFARSISDTLRTHAKIPYTRAFHEVISILATLQKNDQKMSKYEIFVHAFSL